jgi:hypothetical protein
VASDPEAREAALAGGRLLRRSGAWPEAAELLARAAEGHGDAAARAEVCLELGQLRAGPLEDVEGALDAYARARSLAPDRLDVREAYAALLLHFPERAGEAQDELALVLGRSPARVDSIRRMVRVGELRGDERMASRGRAILAALGVLSPLEREGAPATLDFPVEPALAPADAASEQLRAVLAALAEEREEAAGPPEGEERAAAAWRAAVQALVGDDVLGLETHRLRVAVIERVAAARDERLSRRARRSLRALEQVALERFDFATWRDALRLRAWARSVDSLGGDLAAALRALLVQESGEPPAADADLSQWVAASAEASELLGAVIRAWLAR